VGESPLASSKAKPKGVLPGRSTNRLLPFASPPATPDFTGSDHVETHKRFLPEVVFKEAVQGRLEAKPQRPVRCSRLFLVESGTRVNVSVQAQQNARGRHILDDQPKLGRLGGCPSVPPTRPCWSATAPSTTTRARRSSIVNDMNEVVSRPLRAGALHDGLRAIEDGLKPGERVIVNGLQLIRPGITLEPKLVDMPTLAVRNRESGSKQSGPARVAKTTP